MAFNERSQGIPPTHMVPLKPLLSFNSDGVKGKAIFLSFLQAFLQFLAIFIHGDGLREINLRMNGPRIFWGRGPQLAVQLFIIFNRGEIFMGSLPNECIGWFRIDCTSLRQFSLAYKFVSTSWMAAEQIMMARQNKAKCEGKRGEEFMYCHVIARNLYLGMSLLRQF